jgi:hypothetical protein
MFSQEIGRNVRLYWCGGMMEMEYNCMCTRVSDARKEHRKENHYCFILFNGFQKTYRKKKQRKYCHQLYNLLSRIEMLPMSLSRYMNLTNLIL